MQALNFTFLFITAAGRRLLGLFLWPQPKCMYTHNHTAKFPQLTAERREENERAEKEEK